MSGFPKLLDSYIITKPIDTFVKWLSIAWEPFFNLIFVLLNGVLTRVEKFLLFVPWWLIILLVIIGGWRSSKRFYIGILYGALLFCVGLVNYWDMMIFTLTIVIVSVIISLIIGIPLGIIMAGSRLAENILTPLLDTMQTIPAYVYLIPAALFFGMGRVPGVIATVIYAVPPVMRLTSHAISNVNAEMVEASRAFGSTKIQTLFKIQLPQATPSIMVGINQTIMMAVAMVVTASIIGAKGLGVEVLVALNRMDIGRGFVSGISIVIIAIVLDRLTKGLTINSQKLRKEGH